MSRKKNKTRRQKEKAGMTKPKGMSKYALRLQRRKKASRKHKLPPASPMPIIEAHKKRQTPAGQAELIQQVLNQ